MAKRYVYEKSINGIGDFVYVDLLPEVKRARQFNVNVIFALLFALVLSYTLVFLPFRDATIEFEELNGINNDLRHELMLTEEEFEGYNIDLALVDYERQIDSLSTYRVDFNILLDDVELQVDNPLVNGKISFISYSAQNQELIVAVTVTDKNNYTFLDMLFEGLDWVEDSSNTEAERIGDTVEFTSTFTLEVNADVE
jgi:hypothetical protein